MNVTVLYEYKEDNVKDIPLEALCLFVMKEMDCPESSDVTITFVSDDRIHELNRDYRGIDRPTDVLSFECDNVPFEGEAFDEAHEYELGDIIIAVDVAERQTREYGTTLEQELTLLTVHGLLHLMGYDHIEDDDAQIMEALEDKLIAAWNERNHE